MDTRRKRLQPTNGRRHAPQHRMGCAPGFTLLEIIIVLFLMTLIAGLSGLLLGDSLSSRRLDATAREIAAAMRYARTSAQIHGEEKTLSLNLDDRSYTLSGRGTRRLAPELTIKVSDPLTGDIETGVYPFVFNESGVTEGGKVTLSFKNRTISVQPDPIVGTVLIR